MSALTVGNIAMQNAIQTFNDSKHLPKKSARPAPDAAKSGARTVRKETLFVSKSDS